MHREARGCDRGDPGPEEEPPVQHLELLHQRVECSFPEIRFRRRRERAMQWPVVPGHFGRRGGATGVLFRAFLTRGYLTLVVIGATNIIVGLLEGAHAITEP